MTTRESHGLYFSLDKKSCMELIQLSVRGNRLAHNEKCELFEGGTMYNMTLCVPVGIHREDHH